MTIKEIESSDFIPYLGIELEVQQYVNNQLKGIDLSVIEYYDEKLRSYGRNFDYLKTYLCRVITRQVYCQIVVLNALSQVQTEDIIINESDFKVLNEFESYYENGIKFPQKLISSQNDENNSILQSWVKLIQSNIFWNLQDINFNNESDNGLTNQLIKETSFLPQILQKDKELLEKIVDELNHENFIKGIKIEELYKVVEKDKNEFERSTSSLVKKIVSVIDDTREKFPTYKLLELKTGIKKDLWKYSLENNPVFLEELKKQLQSKYQQAKNTTKNNNKAFWGEVFAGWYNKIDKRIENMHDKKNIEIKDHIQLGKVKKRKKYNREDS